MSDPSLSYEDPNNVAEMIGIEAHIDELDALTKYKYTKILKPSYNKKISGNKFKTFLMEIKSPTIKKEVEFNIKNNKNYIFKTMSEFNEIVDDFNKLVNNDWLYSAS